MKDYDYLKQKTYENSKDSSTYLSMQEPLNKDKDCYESQQQCGQSIVTDLKTTKKQNIVRRLVKQFEAGSVAGSILTLYIGVVGAGMLSIPVSFYQSGYLVSMMIYSVGGLFTYQSCMFLVYASQKTGKDSYMQLAQSLCNKPIMYFIKINLVINNWVYSVAFGVIINRLMSKVIEYIVSDNKNTNMPGFLVNPNSFFYVSIVVFVVALPLTLKKQLTGLSFFGLLGFLISMFNIMIILIYAFSKDYNDSQNFERMEVSKIDGITLTLPTAIFSFICQTNILDIKKELKKQLNDYDNRVQTKQLKIIFGVTFMLATLVYSLTGFLGYFTFSANAEELLNGKDKASIFILGYAKNTGLLVMVELLTILNMGFTLVFCYKPAKDSYFDLLWPGKDNSEFSQMHCFMVVFVMGLLTVIFTVLCQSLQQVIVIVVALQGPLICFILPGYFYQKTFWKQLKIVEHVVIVLFFYLFMVLLSVISLIKLYNK